MNGEDYAVIGRPLPSIFDEPATLVGQRLQRLNVPGSRLAERNRWVRDDGYRAGNGAWISRSTPMIHTRSWLVPQLDWIMEFRADCEVFEKRGAHWYAERDGYRYEIPCAWGMREGSLVDFFS